MVLLTMNPLVLLSIVCILAGRAVSAEPEQPAARHDSKRPEVINFSLLDYRGKYYELHRAEARVVILFFTGNGCPIARQSFSKLRAARRSSAGKETVVWMINSNPQDDRQSIAEEAVEFHIGSTPILMDENQGVARTLGVRRTAEVICIDTKDWTIFYRGAVDDQLTEGAKKPKPTEKYLETALAEFFAGQAISRPRTSTSGCLIQFESVAAGADTPISYATAIAPLLQQKCVGCHSPGNIGPFAMTNYKKVKGWTEMMKEVLLTRRMPPWHADPHVGKFQNDSSLTPEETRTLLQWVGQGAPRGEGVDPLTNAPVAAAEWPLGKPDYVIQLPAAEQIPSEGVLGYRHIQAESPLTEDAWVRAALIRPGNRKVVHHVIVRIISPRKAGPPEDVFFTSWAPGTSLLASPEGTAKFLPKGSKFDFEMHYNTIGIPQTDQTELGLYLQKEPPRMILETRAVETREFNIPPGEADAPSFCVYGFQRETLIFDLIPHMHLRGSWFKYEALYPNGKRELLLSVPKYDFNWQTAYRLAEPKRVPAGTWLLCTGGHDNSAKNPYNPDPAKRVKYGLQSFEEMFMGFMSVAEIPQTNPGDAASGEKKSASAK